MMSCAELAHSHYLQENQQEGFAGMLVLGGFFLLGPLGFVLSILVARRMRRAWPFLAGAAITGLGTVPLLLFLFA